MAGHSAPAAQPEDMRNPNVNHCKPVLFREYARRAASPTPHHEDRHLFAPRSRPSRARRDKVRLWPIRAIGYGHELIDSFFASLAIHLTQNPIVLSSFYIHRTFTFRVALPARLLISKVDGVARTPPPPHNLPFSPLRTVNLVTHIPPPVAISPKGFTTVIGNTKRIRLLSCDHIHMFRPSRAWCLVSFTGGYIDATRPEQDL